MFSDHDIVNRACKVGFAPKSKRKKEATEPSSGRACGRGTQSSLATTTSLTGSAVATNSLAATTWICWDSQRHSTACGLLHLRRSQVWVIEMEGQGMTRMLAIAELQPQELTKWNVELALEPDSTVFRAIMEFRSAQPEGFNFELLSLQKFETKRRQQAQEEEEDHSDGHCQQQPPRKDACK